MSRYVILIYFFLLQGGSCGGPAADTPRGVVAGKAMVVTAHPEASAIGAEILSRGGNAVDAAVAVEYALAVCYPNAGNIGGGGFMLIRLSDGSYSMIDYREKAPGLAHRDMFLDAQGRVIQGLSRRSVLAVGVPGTVAGTCTAHEEFGNLDFPELLQPAIRLARTGFPLTSRQATALNAVKKDFAEMNDRDVPFVKHDGWKEGDTLRQPELATTLERIRDGGMKGFYGGATAELIVEEMRQRGGLMGLHDLDDYRAVFREPVSGSYRGYTVTSVAPPSSGGVCLLQLLKMIEPFSPADSGWNSLFTVHLLAEAEKRVYADRAEYLGDPDFVVIPDLLQPGYIASRMADFDPLKAKASSAISAGRVWTAEPEETTHYSIVDQQGNAVAGTTTLNGNFGSFIVVKGAGFLLNNQMDDFSVSPGIPNMYGLVGGEANAIRGGKRMLSSMTPAIVEKEGELFMVVGSPGGSTIITSVLQTILNVIDHGMGMQQAVSAGRFHHQWLPDSIYFEKDALDSQVVKSLELLGQNLRVRSSIGRVDAVLVLPGGMLEGGADPRSDDRACGLDR